MKQWREDLRNKFLCGLDAKVSEISELYPKALVAEGRRAFCR